MTQALLNNLMTENAQIEKKINFTEKHAEKFDFQEVLDKKNASLSTEEQKYKNKKVDSEQQESQEIDSINNDLKNKQVNESNKNNKNTTINEQDNVEKKIEQTGKEQTGKEKIDKEQIDKEQTDENNLSEVTLNNILLNIIPVDAKEEADFDTENKTITQNSILSDIENDINSDDEDVEKDSELKESESSNLLIDAEFVTEITNSKNEIQVTPFDEKIQKDLVQDTQLNYSEKDVNNELSKDLLEQSDVILTNEEFITEETQTNLKNNASYDDETVQDIVDEDILKELNIETIETECATDNEDGSNLMQHQTAEEQGVKAMLNAEFEVSDFQLEIQKTTNMTQVQNTKTNLEANPSKILEQITKQLDNLQHNSKVNIVLNPESLGKVVVQLVNTKEGLSAQFTCATQEARNLLMKGVENLKETLTAQGINVENVAIKQEEAQSSNYQPDWTEQEGSRGGNKQNQRGKHSKDAQQQFEQAMFNFENENKENV